MPWKRTEVSEQRVQFVVRAVSRKESMAGLCRQFGISRPTGYLWRERYWAAQSLRGLQERSRRPHRSPAQIEAWKEDQVVALRQQYGWGAKKLAVLLAEQGIVLTVTTINRILQRRGLVLPEEAHRPAVERFERARPNELWQMDAKGWYATEDGRCTPLSVLDDHSRYAVGLHALAACRAENVQRCLLGTFEQYGVPEAMLMDHDPLWWSMTNGYGLTWLSVWLLRQAIELHYGAVAHPQTQGKVERFHRTLDKELRHRGLPRRLAQWGPALAWFQQRYNYERPHEALAMQRPAERYQPSARAYQAQPPDWEYPEGSLVKQLNSQGCLEWAGQRWFVCEALAGERVQLEPLEEKLLVSYRHMYVREIDPQQGTSRALVMGRRRAAAVGPSGRPPGSLRAQRSH